MCVYALLTNQNGKIRIEFQYYQVPSVEISCLMCSPYEWYRDVLQLLKVHSQHLVSHINVRVGPGSLGGTQCISFCLWDRVSCS